MKHKFSIALFSLLIGAGAAGFTSLHAAHPAGLGPHGETILSAAALVALAALVTGFVFFLGWCTERRPSRTVHVNPGASEKTRRLGLKAGVYGLIPGTVYRVIRPITDYYGGVFAAGEEMTYVQRQYLPYHGGHTVVFRPRTMYFQDEANADVLNALDTYLEAVPDPAVAHPS